MNKIVQKSFLPVAAAKQNQYFFPKKLKAMLESMARLPQRRFSDGHDGHYHDDRYRDDRRRARGATANTATVDHG